MIRVATVSLLLIAAGGTNTGLSKEGARWPAGKAVALRTTAVAGGLTFCSRIGPEGISGFWEVPAKDIPSIDAALLEHLRSSRPDNRLTLPVSKYERQYLGFSRGQSRFVYINAFPARFLRAGVDPRREIPRICDGGSLSWGIEYDMKEKSFSGFAPNF